MYTNTYTYWQVKNTSRYGVNIFSQKLLQPNALENMWVQVHIYMNISIEQPQTRNNELNKQNKKKKEKKENQNNLSK